VVRDFTYVDDIVAGVMAAFDRAGGGSGFRVCNIGGGSTATMQELLELIEEAVGAPLKVDRQPAAIGDMPRTHADLTLAAELLGFHSAVSLREGVQRTVAWQRAQG
jgi:UDP-glucuronate 4-epimerase